MPLNLSKYTALNYVNFLVDAFAVLSFTEADRCYSSVVNTDLCYSSVANTPSYDRFIHLLQKQYSDIEFLRGEVNKS